MAEFPVWRFSRHNTQMSSDNKGRVIKMKNSPVPFCSKILSAAEQVGISSVETKRVRKSVSDIMLLWLDLVICYVGLVTFVKIIHQHNLITFWQNIFWHYLFKYTRRTERTYSWLHELFCLSFQFVWWYIWNPGRCQIVQSGTAHRHWP